MHVQEILKAIYDNHHYEYLIIDSNMNIVEFSDKVFDFCETENKNCEQVPLEDAVYELCGMQEEIRQIFLGKEKKFTLPYVFKAPDRYVHIHISPGRRHSVPDANGYLYETVIILFEDITQLAKMQQQMVQEGNEKALLLKTISEQNHQLQLFNEEMQRLVDEEIRKNLEKQKMLELQERHSQMGEMISMIIHQWKQPLNAIQLIAQVLKIKTENNSCTPEFLLEKLDGIFKQVKFMDQTIYVFQNFFKPAKEKVKFNVYETLESLLELVRYEYEYKHIQIVLEGEKDVIGFGYPNEFTQVILTLMKNAKDAFEEHPSDNMQITLEVRSVEGGKACICVRDNAGGIPDDLIDDIFELYVTTKEDGTGLGLNIAKRVIENNMNGRITVQNTEEGAEFRILF